MSQFMIVNDFQYFEILFENGHKFVIYQIRKRVDVPLLISHVHILTFFGLNKTTRTHLLSDNKVIESHPLFATNLQLLPFYRKCHECVC